MIYMGSNGAFRGFTKTFQKDFEDFQLDFQRVLSRNIALILGFPRVSGALKGVSMGFKEVSQED